MKLKRIIAGMLAVAMTITFVACSSSDAEDSSSTSSSTSSTSSTDEDEDGETRELVGNTYVGEGLPLVEEPEVYTIYYASNAADYSGDQNTKLINQILSDGTNITTEWTANATDYTAQMTLQIAAGQGMYDAYLGWNPESLVASNTSRFYEFTEEALLDYGFYIYEDIVEGCPNGLEDITKSDGKIWSLPTGVWSAELNQFANPMYINTDWLDAVGAEMPTTMQEYYDVCILFLEEDPNGNGEADEIPVLLSDSKIATNIWTLAGAWGLAGTTHSAEDSYISVEDGIVVPTVNSEAFYDFLVEMNKWYDAGIIYSEMVTSSTATVTALISEGVQGSFSAWTLTETQAAIFEPIPVLTTEGYEGQEAYGGNANRITATMNGFMISASCENPTGLLAWWNYAHLDTEMKRIARDGEEGILWESNDDGTATAITPSTDELPDGIDSLNGLNYTIAWRNMCPIIFGDEEAVADSTDTYGEGQRFQWVDMYMDYVKDEFLPDMSPTAEALEDIALTQTEVESHVSAFIATSIVNGIDESTWATYLAGLDSVNFDEYVQWYQDWVDGLLY